MKKCEAYSWLSWPGLLFYWWCQEHQKDHGLERAQDVAQWNKTSERAHSYRVLFIISPFPVSESILCYFACKTLSPQTILLKHIWQVSAAADHLRDCKNQEHFHHCLWCNQESRECMFNGRLLLLRSDCRYVEEDSGAVVCKIFRSWHIDAVGSSSTIKLPPQLREQALRIQ